MYIYVTFNFHIIFTNLLLGGGWGYNSNSQFHWYVQEGSIFGPNMISWSIAYYLSISSDDEIFYLWPQINNVGTNVMKPTVEYNEEDFSFLMATNFESAYHLSQLAHPLLKTSGAASIVFISSVGGVVSTETGSIYAAAKGNLLISFINLLSINVWI